MARPHYHFTTRAPIDQLDDVFRGVEHWLADRRCFVSGDTSRRLPEHLVHTIYHEHLDYHTVSPFRGALPRVGMEMIVSSVSLTTGGSIRLFVQRSIAQVDQSVDALTELNGAGLVRTGDIRRIRSPDRRNRRQPPRTSRDSQVTRQVRRRIWALPSTPVNHFRIGRDQLDFLR